MDFIVCRGDRKEPFTGDARYDFDDKGLLIVTLESGRQRTYSPSGWDYIEHDAPGSYDLMDSVH